MASENSETQESTCFYCVKEKAIAAAAYQKHIYFVTEKTSFPSAIKYKEVKVAIERCQTCKGKHGHWIIFLLAILVLIGSVIGIRYQVFGSESEESWGIWIISTILGLFVAGFFYWAFQSAVFKLLFGIYNEDKVKSHPSIIHFVNEGWLLDKPDPKSATVSKPKNNML